MYNLSLSLEFAIGDILKLDGCEMCLRKLLKLNRTPEFHPTAWALKNTAHGRKIVSG